jgi:hypothetical protein
MHQIILFRAILYNLKPWNDVFFDESAATGKHHYISIVLNDYD